MKNELAILDLFSAPIAFNRVFVDWTGSVKTALFLSQLIYWARRTRDSDGWIYKTRDEWTEETGLSRKEQEYARRVLTELKFIEERRSGVPARLYFRVVIQTIVSRSKIQLVQKEPTRRPERSQLVGPKGANQLVQKEPTISKTTIQETTKQRVQPNSVGRSFSLLDPEKAATKFSADVLKYAEFSRKRGFHILRQEKGGPVYARGGCAGGWSRHALVTWEDRRRQILQTVPEEKFSRILNWFLRYYDTDSYLPACHTFRSFVDKFHQLERQHRRWIQKQRNGHGNPDSEKPWEDDPEYAGITVVDTGIVRYR